MRSWNSSSWIGFLVTLAAFLSYYLFFDRYPVTRDFPWVNLLLFAIGGFLLFVGLKRAFGQPQLYRGRISGSLLAGLSLLIFGFFGYLNFYYSRQLPPSTGAPRVGQQAPDFALPDKDAKQVSLADLLTLPIASSTSEKPNGVILIFYRGYW
jgi:hypothetical protein